MSSQLTGGTKLWRYLSLDKLIDLLSTEELFFAPLSSFLKADPYEGFLPTTGMDALAQIPRSKTQDIERLIPAVEDHLRREGRELSGEQRDTLRRDLQELKTAPRRFFPAIVRCQTVNCWHANDSESEAMWRLYSDRGRAVAVETDIDAFVASIRARHSDHRVHVYPVKYLDFFDQSLRPSDCTVEGRHTTPFLKRLSYKHENEVRALICRAVASARESENLDFWQPVPVRLPVDVKLMVKRVHVSPYSKEPFGASVTKICDLFGLPAGVVKPSKLLSGEEELLKRLDF
jgi:hypothetical protein